MSKDRICGNLRSLLLFIPIISLLASCSPLRLYSTLSIEASPVQRVEREYGKEERHRLDLYTPEVVVPNSPVIVFFYGGSWKRGDKEKYGFVGQSLSGMGFVTAIPDYRLYPKVTFPEFVEDGALATAWVREHVDQAENGVVVMGHSAGAHTAALLALDNNYLRTTGHSLDLIRGMIGLAGPYGFDPRKYRSTRSIFDDVEPIEKAQPTTFACSAGAPFLLMHGEEDGVVVPENSRTLKRKMDACGGRAEYIEVAGSGHIALLLGLSDSFLGNDKMRTAIEAFLRRISRSSAATPGKGAKPAPPLITDTPSLPAAS